MAYRKIEDSKLASIANAVRAQLDSDVTMTPGEMPTMIGDIGIGYVPEYWRSYLATKATEINAALEAAGENRSAFLWYTDAHWTTNYGMSPMILRYLTKHTGMAKTYFGGDIAVNASGETDILTAWLSDVSTIPNHRSMIGNHDNKYNTDFPTAEECAEFFLHTNRTADMAFGSDATNGKMYYYVDDHIEQTRYIILSTGRYWVYSDEAQWCIDTLGSTPSGWHIVIASHLWLDNTYADTGTVVNTVPPDYTQFLLDVFDAYNYRESGTTAKHNLAYDFSNAGAKIEFIIGGHIHQNYDFSTATGIPVILTECDAWQERETDYDPTKGTIMESCVYAIVADYTAKKVNVINVGRGATRSLTIPDVFTYTNVLKTAIGFDGAVLNPNTTSGYQENARYSTSSAAFSSASGWDASGLIPVSPGDVVRLANITMYYDAAYEATYGTRGEIGLFDASRNRIQGIKLASLSSDLAVVYDDSGNIIQFTAPNWSSVNYAYIGICAQDINADSIITINEEIT